MEQLIEFALDLFDFAFILATNAVIYIIIKIIDMINGKRVVPTYGKQLITLSSMVGMYFVYNIGGYEDSNKLLTSAIVAPFIWNLVLKPLLCKIKMDYKKDSK